MFLRRSLVHNDIIYMYMIFLFLCRNIWGLAPPPPPPHTKKLATLLLPAFAHQKSGQIKMADSVPPTRYTKSPPLHTLEYEQNLCLTMDVQRMDIQRLPSFEVMIVTATWICAS